VALKSHFIFIHQFQVRTVPIGLPLMDIVFTMLPHYKFRKFIDNPKDCMRIFLSYTGRLNHLKLRSHDDCRQFYKIA